MRTKAISILTALIMALSMIPAMSVSAVGPDVVGTGGLILDTDPAGGYEGDYVVIYNPSTYSYSGYSTGNMTGLIETEIDPYAKSASAEKPSEPCRIDADAHIAEIDAARPKVEPPAAEKTSYNVGDTHSFYISSYSPGPSDLLFKCLAKGDHCYVWTPASNSPNYYPLDSIDPDFGQQVADEFDSKYPEMISSFGNHSNGSNGDGRINLMYYNIDDGFVPGVSEGYVAGYFSSYDFSSNGYPMIHIDTYPGVYYVNEEGEDLTRLSRTFGVCCHEFQHLINYSQTGGMDTWLNECMSAAAEEICYPGSSVVSRIQSWERYYYSDNDDWLDPPHEFEYFPDYELHNGYSMYSWSSYLNYVLPLYSQVSFFSQYLFTHYGNTIFKNITQRYSQNSDAVSAISSATNMSTSELVKNFRIALVANDYSAANGEYGFIPQQGYDPENYHGVENPYNLLGPVVFTGTSCEISGGGAITVKPVGGVYNPPTGASSSLVYIGVTRNIHTEPVSIEGISITPDDVTGYVGTAVTLRTVREPYNANDFDMVWTSSNPSVGHVSGGNYSATVHGLAVGSTTVTCTATDRASGNVFTASATVHFNSYPTINEALNAPLGTLGFTTSGDYPWMIDFDHEGRLCAASSNSGVSNSSSTIVTSVDMTAGETLSFDWAVSSESTYDQLRFYVNGSEVHNISGTVNFTTYTYTAPSTANYTFMWSYVKDYSVDNGSDTGWLDNIVYSGDAGAPILSGDSDLNGTVEIGDALLALRFAMSLVSPDDLQVIATDVNGNGEVDLQDALMILRIAMALV